MSEQQWYCPDCGPEISVTVERIHTFSGPDDYIVCTGCGETVDEKAETPAFVLALQQRIALLEKVEYTGDYGAWDTGARCRDGEGVEMITGLLIPLMGLVLVALAVRWRVWL